MERHPPARVRMIAPGPFIALLLLLIGTCLCPYAAAAEPTTIYSILALSSSSAQEAENVRNQYAALCSPVIVQQVQTAAGTEYEVLLGQFSSFPEAWAHQQKMDVLVPPNNPIRVVSAETTSEQKAEFPVEMPFRTEGMSAGDPPDLIHYQRCAAFNDQPEPAAATMASPSLSLSRDQLLLVGMSAPRHPFEGTKALEQYIRAYPADADTHRAKLTLARVLGRGSDIPRAETLIAEVLDKGNTRERVTARYLSAYAKLNKKSFGESYDAFRAVASDTAVPFTFRLDAMRRAAGIAHKVHNYPDASLAFAQIIASAPQSDTAADARVQLAGIAFELVRQGYGSWQEVDRLCRVAEDHPLASRRDRATAALMHLEQLYEQQRYTEALAEVQVFRQNYNDIPREYFMVEVWEGILYCKLGLMQQAEAALTRAVSEKIPPGEKFAGVEPRARAAVWLAWICNARHDTAARDRWVNMLSLEFPNTEENQRVRAFIGLPQQ